MKNWLHDKSSQSFNVRYLYSLYPWMLKNILATTAHQAQKALNFIMHAKYIKFYNLHDLAEVAGKICWNISVNMSNGRNYS